MELADSESLPVTVEIAARCGGFRVKLSDFPDRIIAATAIERGVPALTRDGKIRGPVVDTIW